MDAKKKQHPTQRKTSPNRNTQRLCNQNVFSYPEWLMTETITARLPDELVQRVDAAVKQGIFSSRSDALRKIIEDHLTQHPELFLDIKPDELLGRDLSDQELKKLGAKLFKGVDVTKLVAEGRGR